ncbi:MAG TPA: GNAT family N-acetyltransferase [Armatimonadota bacterium]|nr:GNAT family N-acetyltransferase [Armatimonadota bacterium]
MLTYVRRQELEPLMVLDPVLHYYPLLACRREPNAPITAWRDGSGVISGALIPCDPPGRAWIIGASDEIIAALVEEIPPESAVTIPLWAEHVVKRVLPDRIFSTEALAVCTAGSIQAPAPRPGFTIMPVEVDPGGVSRVAAAAPARVAHIGCIAGTELAGYCTYWIDGQGAGSIERLAVAEEYLRADIGKTILAAAAAAVLGEGERVIFAAAGDNQTALGAARSVGFRACYWLRCAAPQSLSSGE